LPGADLGVREISFSPDGRRLALDCSKPRHRALLIPANGGVPVEIDSANGDNHGAAFSPDGAWIAYTRYADGAGRLTRIASSGGGSPVDLANIGSTPGQPVRWSPLGDWIATGMSPADLLLTSPDGKSQRVLRKSGYRAFAFNAKGDRIAGLRRDEQRRWTVWSIEIASGVERKITTLDVSPRAEMYGLALHPDGKRFLTSVDFLSSDIWLIDGVASK
jgi:Tol biopolymer transport system component